MKWLRVVIRVPTSTHSNGLRRVLSADKIQSSSWVAVDLFEVKNLQKTITCFSKCSHTKELIVKKVFSIDAMKGLLFFCVGLQPNVEYY